MIVEQIWTGNAGRNFFYMVACSETGEAVAIDPIEPPKALAVAKERGWDITRVFNTHEHADLIAGNDETIAATGAKLIGPQISKGPGWNGGARVPDGRIFFAPSSATSVLCFDPATGEASFIGKISGRGKYYGAVLGADGAVYFVPCHARRVMRLDPRTLEISFIGDDLGSGLFKWYGGVLAPDGCILCAPGVASNAESVQRAFHTWSRAWARFSRARSVPSGEWASRSQQLRRG